MIKKTNNIAPVQINKNKVLITTTTIKDEFYKPLYNNCNLLRIVLHRSIENNIVLNKWYRIDLKLVTEMGLLMDQHPYPIQLSCKLLIKNKFASIPSFIQTRPITEDAWDPDAARSEGFLSHKPIGGIEYRVTTDISIQKQPFYISLIQKSTTHSNSTTTRILPLTVGPLFIIDVSVKQDKKDEHLNLLEGQQYRALQSCISRDTCFLLKEQWNDGTPGKIWDSAITMTKILLKLIANDPNYLSNKRILDLSAGTGYIGLSIAQYYQTQQQHHISSPPHIILTDLSEALELISRNRDLNDIKPSKKLEIVPLSWGNKLDAENITREGRIDMIIASDVLYNVVHFSSLISTFRDLCDESSVIYLCYKQRGFSVHEENVFFGQCRKYFKVSQLDHFEKLELKRYESTTAVRIYKLQLLVQPRWEQLLLKLSEK